MATRNEFIPEALFKFDHLDSDSEGDIVLEEETESEKNKTAGKASKKDRRKKKKEDDWEDDIANELEELSMEANKGRKEEIDQNGVDEPVVSKKEKKRLEEEKKQKKKEKEKARKERLKQEGKLLTEKQKQDKRRAMQLLESMKEQGIELPQKDEEDKKLKRPVYDNRKKKKQQQKTDVIDGDEEEYAADEYKYDRGLSYPSDCKSKYLTNFATRCGFKVTKGAKHYIVKDPKTNTQVTVIPHSVKSNGTCRSIINTLNNGCG